MRFILRRLGFYAIASVGAITSISAAAPDARLAAWG
jgi:hypothetical protein